MCIHLGANNILRLEREQELQELFKRMDDLLIKGCDMHINRNKLKVIKWKISSCQRFFEDINQISLRNIDLSLNCSKYFWLVMVLAINIYWGKSSL